MSSSNRIAALLIAASATLLAACSTQNSYQHAFSEKSAIQGSHREFEQGADVLLRTAKLSLVRQGFTIDNIDPASGIIKATRNLRDPKDEKLSYNIITTVDVTPGVSGQRSTVSLSASQQTVLHREWKEWWHLLWLIPLFPIGTHYETVVTGEGNVTDAAFYNDFFSNLGKALPAAAPAAAIAPPASSPSPPLAPEAVMPAPAAEPAAGGDVPAAAPPA